MPVIISVSTIWEKEFNRKDDDDDTKSFCLSLLFSNWINLLSGVRSKNNTNIRKNDILFFLLSYRDWDCGKRLVFSVSCNDINIKRHYFFLFRFFLFIDHFLLFIYLFILISFFIYIFIISIILFPKLRKHNYNFFIV